MTYDAEYRYKKEHPKNTLENIHKMFVDMVNKKIHENHLQRINQIPILPNLKKVSMSEMNDILKFFPLNEEKKMTELSGWL